MPTSPWSFADLVFGKKGSWSLALLGQIKLLSQQQKTWFQTLDGKQRRGGYYPGNTMTLQASVLTSISSMSGLWHNSLSSSYICLKISALGPYCIDFLWPEKSPCFPLFYLNDVSLHSRLRETPSNIEFGSSSSTWSYNSRVTINKSGLIFPLISSLSVIYFFSSTFRNSVLSLNTKILESFCVVVLSAFYFTETKVNVLTPNTASNSHFCDLIIML